MSSQHKKPFSLLIPIVILFAITLAGITGYSYFEGYNLIDALYMTVISITTAGYTEVRPLSPAGRLFTVALLIASFTTFAYTLTLITHYIASGELTYFFKNRKMSNQIESLKNHVILCGLGRSGYEAAITLHQHKVPFVVIEQDEERIRNFEAKRHQLLYVIGSATEDDTLIKAGIKHARALLTSLPDDADNVFIVLSARSMSSKLNIISRASQYSAQTKLRKAGADSVVMPDKISGVHMASIVSHPDIMEFLNFLTGNAEDGSIMNVKKINEFEKDYRGLPLRQLIDDNINTGQLIAVRTATEFLLNPKSELVLEPGMKLFFLHRASVPDHTDKA